MKRNKLNFFASLLLGVFIISSCGGIRKMKDNADNVGYKVTPEVLEVHGNEVAINIDVRYPAKYFNKKAILTATPVLTYENGETAYESTTVQGESVEDNHRVISRDGGSFSYSGSIPYSKDMMVAELVIRADAHLAGREDARIVFDPIKIGDGVISTSQLVLNDPKVILLADNFQRITSESYEAAIHYVIQRSDVRNTELRKEEIKKLEEYIKAAAADERKELQGVQISAYASPDGPYDLNERLAGERQRSAERYYRNQLQRAKVTEAAEKEFWSMMQTAEDWEGFKQLMEASDIQDKELVLRVLSMYSDPAVREREIKNMSKVFEEIAEKILPQLRRAKLIANVQLVGYSDEELVELVDNDPDALSLEEMLYSATLYEDTDKKLAIYKKAAENYPDSYRAKNNVGYAYYKNGNFDEAKKAFEAAKELNDVAVINNNIGAVELQEGNIAEAEELFTASMGAGAPVNYNLGIVNVMKGNYDAAVNYFGNTADFNTGLARLLNGQPDGALTTLNSVEEPDAMVYYLKAVVGARQNNTDVLFSNLRTAVGMDASLKAHAKKDLEFGRYFANETFTSIVN